jgi:hypothetical protein
MMMIMVSTNSSLHFALCVILNIAVQSTNAFVTPLNRANALTFCSSTPHKRPTASTPTALTAFSNHHGGVTSGSLMLGLDPSFQVGDGVRNAVIGIVVVVVLVSAVSLYIKQSLIPEQMNTLALMVREKYPDRWRDLESKLNEGERIRDRSDLMAELAEIGVMMMKDESEQEMKELIVVIKEKKSQGGEDIDSLREPIEASLGCTIEAFVSKAETNADSKYFTDADKELSELLKAEFEKKDD